ncbi:MAG: hypothetical protein QOE55_7328 [Acidobacteriaceae bacterium]|jgi:hypothetical protein|nr:hypothetical protein [Acidobacteriaceae bacterium]MEA3006146.1 hypothetical protein [Acidobacteriaceae bacterium]
MYNRAMSRRHILAFVTLAIITVMVGALVYEAFDIHDPKPFPIDPEFLLMTFSGLLALCLSTVVLAIRLLGFYFLFLELLPHGLLDATRSLWRPHHTFEGERLLFSPPLSATALRI